MTVEAHPLAAVKESPVAQRTDTEIRQRLLLGPAHIREHCNSSQLLGSSREIIILIANQKLSATAMRSFSAVSDSALLQYFAR